MSCDSISSMEHNDDMLFGHPRQLRLGDTVYSESNPPAAPRPNTFAFEPLPSPGNASMPDADTAFLVLAPAAPRRRHSDRPGLVDWAYPRSSTPLPSNQSSGSTNMNSFDISLLTDNSDSSSLLNEISSSSFTFPSPPLSNSVSQAHSLRIPGRKHRRSGGEVVGLGLFDHDGSIFGDLNAGVGMGVFSGSDLEEQQSGISKTFRDEIAFTFTQDFSGDSADDVFTTAFLDESAFNVANA